MEVEHFDTEDYTTLLNALKDGPSVPATISFRVRWHGAKDRFSVQDATQGFAARFINTAATVEWTAEESGFKFISDPANTSSSSVALIGRERNGVFFSQPDPSDNNDRDTAEAAAAN